MKLSLKFYLFIFESQHNKSYEQWDMVGRLDSEAAGVRKAKKWLAKYEALLDSSVRRSREIPMN